MKEEELLALMKTVDPHAVRVPPGLLAIVDVIANLAAEEEREACATICEGFDACDPKYIAAAIRGRSSGKS